MKSSHNIVINSVAIAVLLGLSAYSGMSTREKDTAIGAGVGAAQRLAQL